MACAGAPEAEPSSNARAASSGDPLRFVPAEAKLSATELISSGFVGTAVEFLIELSYIDLRNHRIRRSVAFLLYPIGLDLIVIRRRHRGLEKRRTRRTSPEEIRDTVREPTKRPGLAGDRLVDKPLSGLLKVLAGKRGLKDRLVKNHLIPQGPAEQVHLLLISPDILWDKMPDLAHGPGYIRVGGCFPSFLHLLLKKRELVALRKLRVVLNIFL